MAGLTQLTTGMTGAEFRTAFNNNILIPENVYNVKDYGALGNGVQDDTTYIQAAINACFAGGGGVVYIPNGIYILNGALQNDVGDGSVDYNSQLYIPATKLTTNYGPCIKIIGESYNTAPWHMNSTDGVVLKSTIIGSGLFPSVICSRSTYSPWSYNNYTKIHLENVKIVVDANEDDGGVTMCGVNFMFGSRSYLNNVIVYVDCPYANTVEPVNKVFGIAQGFINDDFPSFGNILVCGGFYYGVVFGEGVNGLKLQCYRNKYAMMLLGSKYGVHIQYAILHWHQYMITAQDDTYYDYAPSRANLKIDFCSTEMKNEVPEWCDLVDFIYDPNNLLYGTVDHNSQQGAGMNLNISKSNGGLNLLLKNIGGICAYSWRTTERPINPTQGCIGYNTTTDKIELYNGTAWMTLDATLL